MGDRKRLGEEEAEEKKMETGERKTELSMCIARDNSRWEIDRRTDGDPNGQKRMNGESRDLSPRDLSEESLLRASQTKEGTANLPNFSRGRSN